MRDAKNDSKHSGRNQHQDTHSAGLENENNMKTAQRLLQQAGLDLTESVDQQLQAYVQLVREWNPFASLVSRQDVDLLEEVHVPDSLSLAPAIRQLGKKALRLLDIGSGAGFPAIPLKIVLPELEVEMVERGAKKAGFLDKAIGALHLHAARVVHGNFPDVSVTPPDVVTARAVEKPAKILPHLLDLLPVGGIFLCQTALPPLDDRFHVERVEDEWTASGLRRGDLFIIRRLAV